MHLPLVHRRCRLKARLVVLLGFLVIHQGLAGNSITAEPVRSPRRFIPAENLVVYLEYEGLDAHADAWKASAAHRILVDGHAGSMISELARQVLDRLFKLEPDLKLDGADILAISDHLMHRGFVIACHDQGHEDLAMTIVVRDIAAKPARDYFDRFISATLGMEEGDKRPAPVRIRGRDVSLYEIKVGTRANSPVEPAGFDALPAEAPAVAPPVPPPPAVVAATVPLACWWFEGNDLVLVVTPAADPAPGTDPAGKQAEPENTRYRSIVMDTIDGKTPDVTASAAYIAAVQESKDIPGFEPNGLLILDPGKGKSLLSALLTFNDEIPALTLPAAKYIDPADGPVQLAIPGTPGPDLVEIPENPFAPVVDAQVKVAGIAAPGKVEAQTPDLMKMVGIDGLQRIVLRWGFQGQALLSDLRIEAPAPRKGLIACLEQPAFRKNRMPLVPRGTASFVVGSFDASGSYTKLRDLVKGLSPELAQELSALEQMVHEAIGLRGPEDLRHLGPSWSLFRLPSVDASAPAGAEPDFTDYAFVAGIDNPEAVIRMLDTIADRVNHELAERNQGEGPDQAGKAADLPVLALEKLKAPDRGYRLTSPARLVPWLNDDLRPTILVGQSSIALACNLEHAREALSADRPAGNSWFARGELQKEIACLPENLTFLSVGDPHDLAWPTVLEALPGEVQRVAGMLGEIGESEPSVGSALLSALGIPRSGGFRVRIAPVSIPRADQVRRQLFPSVLAATSDAHGFRIISREAFPLACVGGKASVNSAATWTGKKSATRSIKFNWNYLGLGH